MKRVRSSVDVRALLSTFSRASDLSYVFYAVWRMKHTFARDIFMPVLSATLAARPPSYSVILDLDRKVREISFPAGLKPYVKLARQLKSVKTMSDELPSQDSDSSIDERGGEFGETKTGEGALELEGGDSDTVSEERYYSSSESLRDFYASQHRTIGGYSASLLWCQRILIYLGSIVRIVMQYLHRSFFAQAMLDFPTNPLLSPFAPSFLTAYRCASIIIKAAAHQFARCARMAMRVWFLMYHVFSAGVRAVCSPTVNGNNADGAVFGHR